MNTEQLQQLAIEALDDLKALDMTVLDVRGLTTIADTMIVCSGRSSRHVISLAQNVEMKAKQQKVKYIRVEGEKEGEWVIVDLGDVVVHVMQQATREFYNLEDLWEPVKELRENQR
ncbi:MAG: ribosome silencing factor [Gammaproteobacteria bacterium]